MIQLIILSTLLIGALYMLGRTISEMLSLVKLQRAGEDDDSWFKFFNKPKALCYRYQLLAMIGDYYISLHWQPTKHKLAIVKRKYFKFSVVNMRKVINEIFHEENEEIDEHLYNWIDEEKGHYLDYHDPAHEL